MTPPLTPSAIAALVAIVEKMTPGTWNTVRIDEDDCCPVIVQEHADIFVDDGTGWDTGTSVACATLSECDARGIVALRNAAPSLLAELVAALKRIEELESMLEDELEK